MMENMGYSLADIRAATHDNDDNNGFGGDGGWFWIVVLFLFMFGFGGNGMWGGNGALQGALTRSELCQDLNLQNIENGIRGLQNGLCDGFYAQNTTMLQGFNGLQNSLCQSFNNVNAGITENRFAAQQCCCETNRNIDAVRSENYRNTCDITTAIHTEGEQTRALINANSMQDLRDRLEAKNQELQTANFQLSQQAQSANLISALRPFPKPSYITCSPYESVWGRSNGCGCGCDCGCTGRDFA